MGPAAPGPLTQPPVPAATGAAGLYLHVPFCAAICPYCDFAVTRGGVDARERFVRALELEIGGVAAHWGGGGFDTVYLGGGTPSLLDRHQLERVLAAARATLPVSPDAFVVLEANPEDVSPAAVEAWSLLGVRGVSVGVQSFSGPVLRRLGRRHDAAGGRRAVELALAAGFPWVSLDLIYGVAPLPRGRGSGGSAVRWDPLAVALADIETAVALGPHHLSCYQLTVHPGTPFAVARRRGLLPELGDDAEASLFVAVHERLAAAGYPAYEVSSFARHRAHRSPHNTKYWCHVPYLGLGPSAHSFDGARRWWNRPAFVEWADAIESAESPVAGAETLSAQELALEAVLLGLRTADGIDLERLRRDHGVDLATRNRDRIAEAVARGLLVATGERLVPTTRGLAVAEALAVALEL